MYNKLTFLLIILLGFLYSENHAQDLCEQEIYNSAKGFRQTEPLKLISEPNPGIIALDVDLFVDDNNELVYFKTTPDGTFGHVKTIYSGFNTEEFIVFDADADGVDDLAFHDAISKTVIVLINRNDKFVQTNVGETIDAITNLVAADMNQDGNEELLVTSRDCDFIKVFQLGDFLCFDQTRIEGSVFGTDMSLLTPTDIDQDGDVDLLYKPSPSSRSIQLLENMGDETFASNVNLFSLNTTYSKIEVTDIDNNASQDIVLIQQRDIMLILNPNNSSEEIIELGETENPTDLKLVDFDVDGDLDIVVTAYNKEGHLLYNNMGNVEFEEIELSNDHSLNVDLTILDINNDQLPDLVTTKFRGKFYTNLNEGNNTVTSASQFQSADALAIHTYHEDLDNDGDKDIITGFSAGESFGVFENHNDEYFKAGIFIDRSVDRFILEDINNDDLLDIFYVGDMLDYKMKVMLNQGDLRFSNPQEPFDNAPSQFEIPVAFVDFDNDQIKDIIINTGENLIWRKHLGNGSFESTDHVIYTHNSPLDRSLHIIQVLDYDNDGDEDIISMDGYTGVFLFKNLGGGNFGGDQENLVEGNSLLDYLMEDFNGDGFYDVVMIDFSTQGSNVELYLGSTSGLLKQQNLESDYPIVSGFLYQDFDGDGIKDLIAGGGQSHSVISFIGSADGTFQKGQTVYNRYEETHIILPSNTQGKEGFIVATLDGDISLLQCGAVTEGETLVSVLNMGCNDSKTPLIDSDDRLEMTIQVNNTSLSGNYELYWDELPSFRFEGAYNQESSFTLPFSTAERDLLQLTVVDAETGVFITEFTVEPPGSCSLGTCEKHALLLRDFYHALDGPNWTNNNLFNGWHEDIALMDNAAPEDFESVLNTIDVSTWTGVSGTCDEITLIKLENRSLSGDFPGDILKEILPLTILILNENNITGEIKPSFFIDKKWNRVIMADNLISKLPDTIPYIADLDLENNNISGELPVILEFYNMNLSDNELTGEIKQCYGAPNRPHLIDLSGNQLTGPLLSTFGQNDNLKRLFLNGNQLSGPFPPSLAKIAANDNFYLVRLQSNNFSECIPIEYVDFRNQENTSAGLGLGNNPGNYDIFRFYEEGYQSCGSDLDMDGFEWGEDCDDDNADINPGGIEIANNDIDEDCDGVAVMIDVDGDGFNSDEDCDDDNADINPDAEEIPDNGIDENCDGFDEIIDSIHEIEDVKISIYPNPVNDILWIENENFDAFQVRLYSMNGQLIFDELSVQKIDVSDFTSGMYLLKIIHIETGKTIQQKILVDHN